MITCPNSNTGSHYWLIETTEGETSPGRCKYCGEEREFSNKVRDYNRMEVKQRYYSRKERLVAGLTV